MAKPLRVLLVEDSEDDALLVVEVLRRGGYAVEFARVQTAETMRLSLTTHNWDIVLCDYAMPGFDAPSALQLLRASGQDLPFVIISGRIGEDIAVESLKQGADDYLLKQNLTRLIPALQRSLQDADNRRARRAAERAHGLIMANSLDVICTTDEAGRLTAVSEAARGVWAYEPAELVGRRLFDLAHPEDRSRSEQVAQAVRAGQVTRDFENQVIRKDGSAVAMMWSAQWSSADALCYWIGRDVTGRKQMESILRENEKRFRALVENAPDGIYVELDMRFAYVNQNAIRLFGAETSVQLVGMPVLGRCHPGSRALAAERLRLLNDERKGALPLGQRYLRLDGTPFDVEVSGVPLNYEGRDGGLVFFRDVTDRKRLEDQLRQAQKLEAIGQLAGGVAHDFNNILAATLMKISLLSEEPSASDEIKAGLQELETEAQRAASLTRQLLMFSRRSVLKIERLDLNAILGDLLKMLRRLIGEHINLRFEAASALSAVEADAGMMEQVVMNLAVNARDAMPKGGQLAITTGSAQFDAVGLLEHPSRRPGCFVCLAVADLGCGMDERTLKRIFEPFFTTKEVGKGTGLGLATVSGIVAQHNGWVEVESEVGKGSTFRVYLPAVDKALVAATSKAAPERPRRGHETILLAEDEPAVRQVLGQCLRALGYRVFETSNGREALAEWEKHGPEIDLLFTDMVMPEGLTGWELGEQLRESRPGLKVIITSGYSAEMTSQGMPTEAGVVYLPKPYQASVLAATVRACLDEK
jgi:two-component system cell cycle sensor histidine kinase/response regulator CckA